MEATIGYLAEAMLILGISVFAFLSLVVPWSAPWLKPHRHDDRDDAENDTCPSSSCPLRL